MNPIPLVDLKAQYLSIKKEIDVAIAEVLNRTSFILDKGVEAFEAEFAQYCKVKYAIGVGSGTDALHLALRACGIGPDCEVITVPNTFVATVEAITMTGAMPVFVDVEPESYNIDARLIEGVITKKTRAIIPVHLFGQPADMEPLLSIARKYNLVVIEDAAQAHGAEYKGKRAGSLAEIGCFSFYPGKNLGAYGDGGAVVTNRSDISEKVKMLRNHGDIQKYEHRILGYNSRLDSIQAAVLRVKLHYLDRWNENRRQHAMAYNSFLKEIREIITPIESEGVRHIYHLYVVIARNRDGLFNYLKEKGVMAGLHYPMPLHLEPSCAFLGYRRGNFPVAERLAKEIIALPMFSELTVEQIKTVVGEIKLFYKWRL